MATSSYRQKLRNQQNAGLNRFSQNRGRVMSGFGGTLAGYTQNLQMKQAEMEDELMNKKFQNGEITLDELMLHLTKAAERPWVGVEQKALLLENIQSLQTQKTDELMASQYKSGRMTATQMASYERSKLSTVKAGTPVYDQILSNIATWDKEAKKEAINLKLSEEQARIAGIEDPVERYLATERAYNGLADMANKAGEPELAFSYQEAANQAKVQAKAQQESVATAKGKEDRLSLVNQINLAYDQYHDKEIDANTFLAKLDSFERTAISKGYSDLLNDMNSLVDTVNKDLKKAQGTASYIDPITGELVPGSGGSGGSGGSDGDGGTYTGTGVVSGGKTGTPAPKGSWTEQDETFTGNVNQLHQDVLSGKISKEQYIEDMRDILSLRRTDLIGRETAIQNSGKSKIYVDGKNTNVNTVLKDIEDELTNNWGKKLGMSEKETGGAGVDDYLRELINNPDLVKNSFDLVVEQSAGGVGSDYSVNFQKRDPFSKGFVTDEKGVTYKVNSGKTIEGLTPEEYQNEIDKDPNAVSAFKLNPSTGKYEREVDTFYADVPGEGGYVRYTLDNQGNVIGRTPNFNSEKLNGVDVGDFNTKFQDAGVKSPNWYINELTKPADPNAPIKPEEGPLRVLSVPQTPNPVNTNWNTININGQDIKVQDPSFQPKVVAPKAIEIGGRLNQTQQGDFNQMMGNLQSPTKIGGEGQAIKTENGSYNPVTKQYNQVAAGTNKLQLATPPKNNLVASKPQGFIGPVQGLERIKLDQSLAPNIPQQPVQKKDNSLLDKVKNFFKLR